MSWWTVGGRLQNKHINEVDLELKIREKSAREGRRGSNASQATHLCFSTQHFLGAILSRWWQRRRGSSYQSSEGCKVFCTPHTKLETHSIPSFDSISKFDSAKDNSFSNLMNLRKVTLKQEQQNSTRQARGSVLRVLMIGVQAETSGGNLPIPGRRLPRGQRQCTRGRCQKGTPKNTFFGTCLLHNLPPRTLLIYQRGSQARRAVRQGATSHGRSRRRTWTFGFPSASVFDLVQFTNDVAFDGDGDFNSPRGGEEPRGGPFNNQGKISVATWRIAKERCCMHLGHEKTAREWTQAFLEETARKGPKHVRGKQRRSGQDFVWNSSRVL